MKAIRLWRYILLAALPGLMLCIIPAPGETYARFSWQLVSIWLAGVVFAGWLRSWWLRIFFVLALVQVIAHGPVATSYLDLVMIGIFMAAIQGFSKIDPEWIMDMMCVAAILLLYWMFLQRIGLAGGGTLGTAAAGPFNINAGSAFLAMCLPAFLRGRRWFLLPVVVWGLFACHSTTGMLATVAAVCAYQAAAKLPDWIWWALTLSAGLLVGSFYFTVESPRGVYENTRWAAWQRTVQSYSSAPLGRGLGSFKDKFPLMTASDKRLHHNDGNRITGPVWQHAHNEYLETGVDMGLQATALVLSFLAWITVSAWRRRDSLSHNEVIALSGIAATAVGAAGFHIFHIAPTALVGCAWIGMQAGKPVPQESENVGQAFQPAKKGVKGGTHRIYRAD